MRNLFLSAAIAGALWTSADTLTAADTLPTRVTGNYSIAVAGIKVGHLNITARNEAKRYHISGEAKVSAMMGAFLWQGKAQSEGRMSSDGLSPSKYRFDWRASKRKHGNLNMVFQSGKVDSIDMRPPNHPSPEVVPIRSQHLQDVVDPLSAILFLATAPTDRPCSTKLAIFDGKLRFDLSLSYARHAVIKQAPRTSSRPVRAVVCQVKVTPVAGHKDDKTTRAIARTQGIELWLRQVDEAGMLIPHEVRIPTFAGNVTIEARRIDIVAAGNRQIALVN